MTDPLRSPEPFASPEPLPGGRPLSLLRWCWEGLRAACFLPPRVAGHAPRPWQVLVVVLAMELLGLGLSRLWIVGPADFWPSSYLASWWWWAPMLWAAWWALSPRTGHGPDASTPRPQGLGSWVLLASLGPVPGFVVMGGVAALVAHGLVGTASFWTTAVVALQWISLAWALAAAVVLMARFSRRVLPTAGYAAALAAVMAVQLWVMNAAAWSPPAASEDAGPAELSLSQEVFEDQQAAWNEAVDTLAPQRPGISDVYGLVFAPYAAEDVFRRESTMVAQLLRERFDGQGRVLQLLNHADTAAELPWATPLNLERAIDALAQRMDLAQDVLVVYMTSHGGGDFRLAAYHGPLAVESVTPQFLRTALDRAGIRNRVIAISACYSGGWVEPLATPGTLVMTAADADHTSYGCGHKSPMTFFGRAVFDEQLRRTHDFGQAFAAAVPVIKQREEEAGKSDGFSNPQIRIGSEIAPVLRGLQQRLDGAAR